MNKQLKSNPTAHRDEFSRSSTCRRWLELHTLYVDVQKQGAGCVSLTEENRPQNPSEMYGAWGTFLEKTEFLLHGHGDHHLTMSVRV